MGFKKDFVWGAATASYQIEGAAYEGGKGLSVWDVFSKQPGKVFEGHNGDEACDHYHRYKDDIALMKQIGLKAYRFSISWPRILPAGTGAVNPKGIEFYSNLIDELLANGIEPYITLYHWDYPYALHKLGGWLNPDSPKWFENYAKIVAEQYSDRVSHFITFNEPQCFIGAGYYNGGHAPGLKCSDKDLLQMTHNVLLAHGLAVRALRQNAKQDLVIGYAPCGSADFPASQSADDIEAARMRYFAVDGLPEWTQSVSWWNDPLFLGCYPEEGLKRFGSDMPQIGADDFKIIGEPIDFLGQNIYCGNEVKMGSDGQPELLKRYPGAPRTAMNAPITPQSLYWAPKFLSERYGKPILITENGLSCHDVISLDGRVHDPNRIDFLTRYLREYRRAADDGVDLMGYFAWSLMDNFEWALGYSERFGMIYVDYPTQKRVIKDSGHWYRTVIESNGETL